MAETAAGSEVSTQTTKKPGLELGLFGYGIAVTIVTLVVSLLIWYAIGQKTYPQPFGVNVFWAILVIVWMGFNTEMWPFGSMRQPLGGILACLTLIVIQIICIWFLNFVIGARDPVFNINGTGWTATGMVVLFGFYTYAVQSNAMAHWPWTDLGLKQPAVGIIEFFVGSFFTMIFYMLLMYPTLAPWTAPDKVLMPLPVVIGWYYQAILFWLTTVLLFDNWPWSKIGGSRAGVALVSFFGNFIGATVWYFVFLYLLKAFLIPADALAVIGAGLPIWTANFGVCILAPMLVWALAFRNWPTQGSAAAKYITRFIIVYGLGVIIFFIHTRWFGAFLGESTVTATFGGDPLNFYDLFNLVLLIYIVFFGTWLLSVREK